MTHHNLSLRLYGEEKAYYLALKSVVSKYGKFNDNVGVWVGYEPAEKNKELAEIGVKCSNCAFYLGNGQCEIIESTIIEDEGKCRLAAIPDNLVSKKMNKFWGGYFAV